MYLSTLLTDVNTMITRTHSLLGVHNLEGGKDGRQLLQCCVIISIKGVSTRCHKNIQQGHLTPHKEKGHHSQGTDT